MIPKHVSGFRENHLQSQVSPSYNGWLHLAFTSISSLAVIAYAGMHVSHPSWKELLIVPLTFLYANLVEYVGHRGPMHNRYRPLGVIFQRHACEHHRYYTHDAMKAEQSRDFAMVLFPPVMILFFLGLFAFPVAFLLGHWISANVGFLFLATGVAYFLNYEWFHFAYHTPEDFWVRRLPGMGRLMKLHTVHHDPRFMKQYCFNITYPICDFLFKTYRSKST